MAAIAVGKIAVLMPASDDALCVGLLRNLTGHITRVSRPVDGNMVQLWPEPKFKDGQSVDTTCSTRIPVCWPATVLGAEWRDGRHWYSLRYPAGTKCGFIWDEPCLFLAPEPCPFKEGDVLVSAGAPAGGRECTVKEVKLGEDGWDILVDYGDEPPMWSGTFFFKLAPEPEWTPKAGEWVTHKGYGIGYITCIYSSHDCGCRFVYHNGDEVIDLSELKPHTPPVDEVREIINTFMHNQPQPDDEIWSDRELSKAICDACQVILIKRDAG